MNLYPNMKTRIRRSVSALAMLGITLSCISCQEDESMTRISLDQQQVMLDAVSLSGTFNVNSNEDWGIYKGDGLEWLTVSPATGNAGDTEVTISGTINRTASRDAVLTIRTASGEDREIKIVQGIITKENSGTGQINDIRNMKTGTISQNLRICGIVTSEKSNTDGKTLFMQSTLNARGTQTPSAIALKFEEEYDIQTGEEIEVWVLAATLEVAEKGLYQISNLPLGNIISHKMAATMPEPQPVSITELMEGGWDGQLVCIEGVEFMNTEAIYAGEQKVWDEAKNELRVMTEATALFKDEKVAQGNGRLVGNVSYLNGTPVVKMRTTEDASDMSGELIHGSFLTIETEDEVICSPIAHTHTVKVTANTGLNWTVTIENGDGWCSADKMLGNGNGSFTLTFTGNRGNKRSAVITVSAPQIEPQSLVMNQLKNGMPNGDLEEWSNGLLPGGWDYNQGSKPVSTDYKQAGSAHTGNSCIQFTNFQNTGTSQTTGGYFVQEIPVEGNKTYRISYWGKIVGPNVRYRIYSRWRSESGGGNLDTYHTAELRSSPYIDDTNNEWVQYSVTLTAPAEARFFNFDVRPYCKNAGGVTSSVFLDDFEVVEVPE